MKPTDQTVFGYPNGNCFAACVASILEIPIEETPSIEGKHFEPTWDAWFNERGLTMVDVPAGDGAYIQGFFIATGKSPRGGLTKSGRPVLHSVVAQNMTLVHDPHPEKRFLDGPPTEYTVICALDWSAWKHR